LNLRPLGYEFNTSLWLGVAVKSRQQVRSSMSWLILAVSGPPVSNLLALSPLGAGV